MDIARHEPANWTRIIDDKISSTSEIAHREMLATLKKRLVSASAHDIDGFLSTFAPDFLRTAYSNGSVATSDLDAIRPVAGLRTITWPEINRLMVDGDTIAVEGCFNVVLADASARQALGVVVDDPDAKYLLSAPAALFIEFRGGVQIREIAYGATSPTLSRLAADDILCKPALAPPAVAP